MTTEHPTITRFRDEHARLGGTGEIVILPDSVHTAALAAEALGCEVGAIANSLLFDAGGSPGPDPHLGRPPGRHRQGRGDASAWSRLKRATPEFVREHTGQVIGGVSPIAHPTRCRPGSTRGCERYDVVWAAAGHPAAVFSTTYAELAAMTGATDHRGGVEPSS